VKYEYIGKYENAHDKDVAIVYEMCDYIASLGSGADESNISEGLGYLLAGLDNSSMQEIFYEFLVSKASGGSAYAAKALAAFYNSLSEDKGLEKYKDKITGACAWGWYYHAYLLGLDDCRDKVNLFRDKNLSSINFAVGMPSDYNQALFDVKKLNPKASSAKAKKTGCYIATAVYGSYDAPEVLVLRRFRDEFLAHSVLGRSFINIYYFLSPPFAERLKNTHRINAGIRSVLNRFVSHVEKH